MVLDASEFDDMIDEITHRFSKANIDGSLMDLLRKLGWSDLISYEAEPLYTFKNGKILVISAQTVEIDKLRMTVNKLGLDISNFEFVLDYNKAQTFNYGMATLPTVGCTPSRGEMKPYNGGARFQNGDSLLARITPCFENGKN